MSQMSSVDNGHPVLLLNDLHKVYNPGSQLQVHVLKGVSLAVERGDYVAIMGHSGSGKSTMLNILGCLDVPTGGTYMIDGVDVSSLSEGQLADIRNQYLGFVFQSFNLVRRTTALANVELPLVYAGVPRAERRRRAMTALGLVGLEDRGHHQPSELSGGQQQRVAIARAICTGPSIILADEPTGNLDSRSTEEVLQIFGRLNAAGRTIVIITHEDDVAAHAKRVVILEDGRIGNDYRNGPVQGDPPGLVDLAALESEVPEPDEVSIAEEESSEVIVP
ncbi:MAG TPA: ABC transporter ATP-binding protein [Acidimicrobiia bacterium]|nr:ABC transporter ATP-binding protein [Acidimicrobiia bacterium]